MFGSIVALVTPFKDNMVDYDKLKELLEFHIENETDGLLLLGTTAESSTLEITERYNIVVFCNTYLENKIPLMVGICTNNTQKAVIDCKYYENIGIKNFLVISPYYNKSNDEGLYKHFETIANSTNSEITIYNIPSRSTKLPFELIKKLSLIDNITGIKEANDNFKETIQLFSLKNFKIYCGNDELILPFLALKAQGVINVSGNIIPKQIHDIYNLCIDNEFDKALETFNTYKEIILSIFLETNPIGIKEAMDYLSLCSNDLRLPLYQMSKSNSAILKKELDEIGKFINS